MLSSAFAAVAATFYSGSPWIGLMAGVVTGGLIGVVMGVLSVYTESNQVVVGFGINLVAIGMTPVLLERVWGNSGRSDAVAPLPAVHVPGLRSIPLLGPAIDAQAVTFYMLVVLIGVSWLLINRSVGGLRIQGSASTLWQPCRQEFESAGSVSSPSSRAVRCAGWGVSPSHSPSSASLVAT